VLHIDLPTRAEIAALAAERGAPCVTIYLATHTQTQQAQVDRIELKNRLRDAVRQMTEAHSDKREIWPIEEAVNDLVEDDDFWAFQANSLAVFATPERMRTYRLPNRLETTVQVSDRFHIKPLLRAVSFRQNAYVLVLAAGGVRLVEVGAEVPPHEVRVSDLPADAQQALGRRTIRDVNYPGGTHEGSKPSGMNMPDATGEGESKRDMLVRYARTIDRALRPVLSGHERPLIVAAAEPMASVWRRVNSYPHLADQLIAGNAEHMSDGELAEAARKILDGIHAEELAALAETFGNRRAQGRGTADLSDAARAATFGAIDTLIFDMDAVVPGTVDETDGTIRFAEGESAVSYGIVDEIAGRALATGARVIAARREDVPGGGDLAAILRYPI
jgi:Bacterial archaeo-eukaryotic release factor family 11